MPPERTAIFDLGGGQVREISYGELDGLCDGFARGLRREGLREGDRIAILSLNRWAYIVAVFGAMRLGVVPVLINVRLAKETVAYILKDLWQQNSLSRKPPLPLWLKTFLWSF